MYEKIQILVKNGPEHEIFENGLKLWGFTFLVFNFINFILLFKNLMLNYYILYFVISVLGIVYPGPFFNSILILDVIHKFPVLSNVIKAVKFNI